MSMLKQHNARGSGGEAVRLRYLLGDLRMYQSTYSKPFPSYPISPACILIILWVVGLGVVIH